MELHKGAPRNIVTVLTTTMADVGEGKTANTHMYAKSVAGLILRDCADNHIKERVNQSLTTDQRIVSFTICLLSKITYCSMHNNVAVLPPSLTVF